MIKYAYTILYVQQVKSAMDFYESAFGFAQKFITPEQDYGEMVSGETTLAFASRELGNTNLKDGYIASSKDSKPFGIELVFAVEEVDALLAKALAAGATLVEPIATKPWGQKVGYIRDIDGFLIELCTPMKQA